MPPGAVHARGLRGSRSGLLFMKIAPLGLLENPGLWLLLFAFPEGILVMLRIWGIQT